jgi:lysine-N-methylase
MQREWVSPCGRGVVTMASHPDSSGVEPALLPLYAQEFQCIGAACEDTCCEGWTVKVDEASYHKYQALPPGAVQESMRLNLVQIATNQTSRVYAEIRMTAEEVCPFLDTDRLCTIQKEHGEEYLSGVCSQYPRMNQSFGGRSEQTLVLSCPAAARLVLLHPELLREPTQLGAGGRYRSFESPRAVGRPPAPGAGEEDLTFYFWTIRTFALMLLKDRSYPIWQRLFLLGMMAKRLESLQAEHRIAECPTLLNEYAVFAGNGSLRPAMDEIPSLPALQLTLVMHLLGERARMRKVTPRFDGCLDRFMDGLGCGPGRAAEALTPAYLRAFREHYRPWREANPGIIENYLLNAAMGSAFPIGLNAPQRGLHPWHEHLRLAIHYGLIQGLLIGMAAHTGPAFSTEDAILLIQSFVKTFEHNPGFIEKVIDLLERQGLNNSRGLAAFVRDPA